MKAKLITISLYDIKEHAQDYMKRMGVTYMYAVPQSIADCWQFYCCENLPQPLPRIMRVNNDFNPENHVGRGLSKEMSEEIIKWSNSI